MNAKDMIALMEYGKTFNTQKKTSRFSRKEKREKKINFYELLREKEEELTLFKKFLEDFEKTHKKDEKKDSDSKKKDEKKGMGAIELFILATLASPLIFLAELAAYAYVIDYVKHMVH